MSEGTTEATMPGPGMHEIAEPIYRALPYVNQSALKTLARSPAHAFHALHAPEKTTDAKEWGQLFHVLCLEPHRLEEEFLFVEEKIDRRTKAGKERWAELQAQALHRTIIRDPEQWDNARMCRDSLLAHPEASHLLVSQGRNEVTFVWGEETYDEEGGAQPEILCKGRADRMVADFEGWPVVVDVKSTRNAGRYAFSDDIGRYGYDLQAAFYLRGLHALYPASRKFMLVAVEKEPPFAVQVFEIDEDSLSRASEEIDIRLAKWAACEASGVWPGYPTGVTQVYVNHERYRRGNQ